MAGFGCRPTFRYTSLSPTPFCNLQDDFEDEGFYGSEYDYLRSPPRTQQKKKNSFMGSIRANATKGKGCFHTTVIVESGQFCYKVTNVLFDTGAAANFVSRRLVDEIGLQTLRVDPESFEIGDGSKTVHNEMVHLQVWIAGVVNRIEAYVDDSKSTLIMLLGEPALDRFLCDMKAAHGNRREWKVTVAQDYTGLRNLRLIVEQDKGAATITRLGRAQGIAYSKRHGKTTKEVEAEAQRARYSTVSDRFYGACYY